MKKQMIHPDDLLNSIEELERFVSDAIPKIIQKKIIVAFENRGWALYPLLKEGVSLHHPTSDLRKIITAGRAKDELFIGKKYCLLPLHEYDTNFQSVYNLLLLIIHQGRGPYYIDFKTKGITTEATGVFFVNYIEIEPPAVHLVFDAKLSTSKIPLRCNTISIGIDCITEALKLHFQKSLR